MSDIRFMARHGAPAAASNDQSAIRADGTRDGALFTAPYALKLAMEGLVYVVDTATGTTPDTFNATYAATEPDLHIHVPNLTTIIPLYIEVGFEDTGTAQVLDVVALASSTGDSACTGTSETITNLRTDGPNSSSCTATSVVTGSLTDPHAGSYYEFWRPYMGFGEDAFNGSTAATGTNIAGVKWSMADSGIPPIIVGDSTNGASLSIWASAQAGTGFITVVWAEIPSTRVT
jgi:hypothetical protein